MKTRWYLVSVALLAMGLVGCGGQSDAPDAQGSGQTPHDVFAAMQAAVAAGDDAAFIACFDLTEAQKPLMLATFDLAEASAALKAKATEVFGDEAAQRLRIVVPFQDVATLDIEACTFVDGGDTAVFVMPNGAELTLVKTDSGWLFASPGLVANEVAIARNVAYDAAVTDVMRGLLPELDTEGMTYEMFKGIADERLNAMMREQQLAEAAANAPPELGTPQRAVFDLIDALNRGDRDAVVGSFYGEDKQLQVLGVMFDLREAIAEFEGTVAAVFGPDAASYFRAPGVPFAGLGGSRLTDYRFGEIEDDTLMLTGARTGDNRMRRVEGVWQLSVMVAPDFPRTDEACDKAMAMLALSTEMYRGLTIEATREGMTFAQLAESTIERNRIFIARQVRMTLPPRSGSAAQDAIDAATLPVADTPLQAMDNVRTSLLTGNRGGFMAAFEADSANVALLIEVFDMAQATRKFETAVVEAFGEEGQAVLSEGFEAVLAGMASDEIVMDEDGEHAAGISAVGPDIPMAKINGVWKVVMPDMTLAEADLEMAITMIRMTSAIREDMAALAGTPGMTLDKLMVATTERMAELGKLQALEMQRAQQLQQFRQAPPSDEALLPPVE